MVLICICWL